MIVHKKTNTIVFLTITPVRMALKWNGLMNVSCVGWTP